MAELLVNQEICKPISSRQMLEKEYETSLLALHKQIFPGWKVCSFKADIEAYTTPHGRKRADLALIDNDFMSWWIVEVELAHHSLKEHVAPQVEVLALGEYGEPHVKAIGNSLQLHDEEKQLLRNLVANRQPRVVVVVNDYVPKWRPALSDFAEIMVVLPYEDQSGNRHFLIDGSRPGKTPAYLTVCIREPVMPGSLLLKTPDKLGWKTGQKIVINLPTGKSVWTFYHLGKNAFLFSSGTFPLGNQREYILGYDGSGDLFLRPLTSTIRRQLK